MTEFVKKAKKDQKPGAKVKAAKQPKAGRRAGKKRHYDRYRIEGRREKNKLRRMWSTFGRQPRNEELFARIQFLEKVHGRA